MTDASICPARPQPTRAAPMAPNYPPSRHRLGDDLLANLAPPTVVDALAAHTGPIKACLDAASAADRDFVFRSALASQRIWEWLAELQDWPWPSEADDDYMASLSAADVARCGRRIDQIHHYVDDLGLEDIKSHVLCNHIGPLSRPTTPMTGSGRRPSSVSSSCYNKMEDLTAVTAAIVLNILPNLARLSCLLHVWTRRLHVLRRVPHLLLAMEDAEVCFKSAWAASAVSSSDDMHSTTANSQNPFLNRQDFEAARCTLSAKVAQVDVTVDGILDCLEGTPDIVPRAYMDRVEAIDRDFSKWIAVCDKRILETQWSTLASAPPRSGPASASPTNSGATSSRPQSSDLRELDANDLVTLPPLSKPDHETGKIEHGDDVPTEWESSSPCYRNVRDQSPNASSSCDSVASGSPGPLTTSGQQPDKYYAKDGARAAFAPNEALSLITDDSETSTVHGTKPETAESSAHSSRSFESAMTPVEETEEPELPRLRESASRTSLSSQASTLIFEETGQFGHLSSDPAELLGSPLGRPRRLQHFDDASPRTPPRLPKSESPEPSTLGLDKIVASPPYEDAFIFFKSPADQSFVDAFDDSASMTGSLSHGEPGGDRHLEQQISDIIESIPAKIKLFSEPTPVNLNPPELPLPGLRRKPSKELFKRSASTLSVASSRGATPSFTLSPAKQPQPRQKQALQDIQVYHLARSTGEAPIKLYIRCVGEHGQRVMVRVGGGWADLSDYLKEYVSHHGRRSARTDKAKVEFRDVPRAFGGFAPNTGSSPSRPGSAAAQSSPVTPIHLQKARRAMANVEPVKLRPSPMAPTGASDGAPPLSFGDSARSGSSSHLGWYEDESSFLGLAGPTGKKVEMSAENKAWVESVKQTVRLASGERRGSLPRDKSRFGDLGQVGSTKRLFRHDDSIRR